MYRWMITVCLMVGPQTGAAQDLVVSEGAVRDCFAQTPMWERNPACLGQASNVCQERPGGSTTIGITECISGETAVWDAILNDEYNVVRDGFSAVHDRVGGRSGDDFWLSLRNAQRAWIAFRDAECNMQYHRFFVSDAYIGDAVGAVVGANCRMTMTASRALDLRDMQEGAR